MQNICADSVRIACPLFQAEGGGVTPTSALQLNIVTITSSKAAMLNELWHSRMPKIDAYAVCKPCFAALYENRFYAIAMWSLPIAANRIKNGNFCLELRRMAIASDAPQNTASRMLAIMKNYIYKNRPDIIRLLSYQDTGVHSGTIYKASGWSAVRTSEYVTWGNHSKRPGRIEQSTAPKVRWEYELRPATKAIEESRTANNSASMQNAQVEMNLL